MTTSAARVERLPSQADGASDAAEGVEVDLGWALGHVFRAYVKAVDAAVDALPGGPRGYQILAAAVRENPDSQLALAQRLGIDRTVMTYLLDDLVGAGLVERLPDPADRRARRIVATTAGKRLLRSLDRQLADVEDSVLAALDVEDRVVLRTLLKRVAQHAQQSEPNANLCAAAGQVRDPLSPC